MLNLIKNLLTDIFLHKFVKPILSFIIKKIFIVNINGKENIPEKDSAIIVSNHVSYVDAILISLMIDRDIRFITWYKFFELPILGWFLRLHKDISIYPQRDKVEEAFNEAQQVIDNKELLGIFPEGSLSPDGTIQEFRHGVIDIWSMNKDVPVIPVGLSNLWDTPFSNKYSLKEKRDHLFKRRSITINIGKPILYSDCSDTVCLEKTVKELSEIL